MTVSGGIAPRARELLEDKHGAAVRRLEKLYPRADLPFVIHDSERFSAVRDTLAWVLGYTDTAPPTRRSIRNPTW